jgi:hypothetical protein
VQTTRKDEATLAVRGIARGGLTELAGEWGYSATTPKKKKETATSIW